jgi:DNA-binding Lrp family transcriptional regulator
MVYKGTQAVSSNESLIVKELVDAGIIPRETVKFSFTAEVAKVVRIEIVRNATKEEYAAMVAALAKHPEEIDTHIKLRDITSLGSVAEEFEPVVVCRQKTPELVGVQ